MSQGLRERLSGFDSQVSGALSGPLAYGLLFTACVGLLLALYWPALEGGFVSDDALYIVSNPPIHQFSVDMATQLIDPWSDLSNNMGNWAPVHMLLHAVEWQLFGSRVFGYHVVQLAVHSLASVLLIILFRGWGIPALASLSGGLIFLVHPANVEAVAWISQLKTTGAMVLALGALILQRERPLLALLCFALALWTKAAAVFALPAAITLLIVRGGSRRDWLWTAAWVGFLLVYLAPQLASFRHAGQATLPLHPDPWVAARTIPAIAARYAVMGMTSSGVAAFHDTPRALGWLDPWWLAGSFGIAACAVRAIRCLVQKRDEAVYWAWLVAAWLPIAQFFPFQYAMADRYLYFLIPALVGLVFVLGGEALARLPAVWRSQATAGALAMGLVVLVAFAARLPARAAVWRSDATLMVDAAQHFPDGISAQLLRAYGAANRGDLAEIVSALERLHERGFNSFAAITMNPLFEPYRADPRFQKAQAAIVSDWLQRSETIANPNQKELQSIALAYTALGELDRAEAFYLRAIEYGGPLDTGLQQQLAGLREARRRLGQ